MRRTTRSAKALGLVMAGALAIAACGGDDDDAADTQAPTESEAPAEETEAPAEPTEAPVEETEPPADTEAPASTGGEFIDGAQFSAAKPPHIDPGFTSELDGAQISQALYDNLTDFADGADGPELKPLVAESWVANSDATQFVFTIKEGLVFSNDEPVLPSSFVRGWNRAADPELATDYSYLFGLVQGFAEWTEDPSIGSLSGVVGDDDAMTLTVDLTGPYADFPSVVSHIIFAPMPSAVDELDDQTEWEQGIMIGNGPFMMESPLTDEELVLVPNPKWTGDVNGSTEIGPSKVVLRIFADENAAYAAFEAGETMSASIPAGLFNQATGQYGNTADPVLGSYHWLFGMRDDDPLGGADKVLLRKAIQAVVDQGAINDAVYDGSRTESTGITPPGIPGFQEALCEACGGGMEAAQGYLDEYLAGGGEIPSDIQLTFGTGAGHEDVAAVIQDNLADLGIEVTQNGIESDVYFDTLRDEGCGGICRAGWFWDYPIYDNGMYDLFHVEAGGNNLGKYDSAAFNEAVTAARQTIDLDERLALFLDAENTLLNVDVAVVPVNWYNGDHVYAEGVTGYDQEALGWVRFEKIKVG